MLRRILERIFTITDGTNSISITASNASAAGLDHISLGFLFRRSYEYKYCEARYGSVFIGHVSYAESNAWQDEPGAPFKEWGAICSAGIILICGCHMLLFWRHDSTLLHLIASLFVVNGIGAAFAHYWSVTSWHRIDGMSMALTAWIAAGFLFEECSENIFKTRRHEGRHAVLRLSAWIVFLFVFWWFSETNAVVHRDFELGETVDFLVIGVPLMLNVAMAVLALHQGWANNAYVDEKVAKKAQNLFVRGLCFALFGVVVWLLTEQLCDSVKWIRWFPGHLFWHISMSYGLTLMLLLGGVLRADNFKKKPRIFRHRKAYNFVVRHYFDLLPEFAHVDPSLSSDAFASLAMEAVHEVHDKLHTGSRSAVDAEQSARTGRLRRQITNIDTSGRLAATKFRNNLIRSLSIRSRNTSAAGSTNDIERASRSSISPFMIFRVGERLRPNATRVQPTQKSRARRVDGDEDRRPEEDTHVTEIEEFAAVLPVPTQEGSDETGRQDRSSPLGAKAVASGPSQQDVEDALLAEYMDGVEDLDELGTRAAQDV